MSTAIRREQCPKCLDSGKDNLIYHDDGSVHCYACNYHANEGEVETSADIHDIEPYEPAADLIKDGEYADLHRHGITKFSCEKYGVKVANYEGYFGKQFYTGPVIVFPFFKKGKLIKQKVKTPCKKMKWIGKGDTDLFLANTYGGVSRKLFITEGEEDALAVAQTLGAGPWQVTTLINGAGSVDKFIDHYYETLSKHELIITAFDNDEAGDKATEQFLAKFPYGKVAAAVFPEKDASDMLTKNLGEQLKWALLKAEAPEPKASVTVNDIMDRVLQQPQQGIAWPWKEMTDITFGRRLKELYVIAGPTGCGKTELIKELVFDILDKGENVGLCSFEQETDETVQRLIGSKLNKKLHLPGEWWNPEIIKEEADKLNERLFLYEKRKSKINLDTIINILYYWVHVKKCTFIVLDNLTAMTSDRTIDGKRVSENDFLSHVATTLFNLVKGPLNCTLCVVAHVNKNTISKTAYVSTAAPKEANEYMGAKSSAAEDMDRMINKPGMHWESGRIPRIEDINGGSHLDKLSDYVIALGRDRTSEDDTEKRILKIKFLKTRKESSNEGRIIKLIYNHATGRLEPIMQKEIL